MSKYEYHVEPFIGQLRTGIFTTQNAADVSGQLERLINQQAIYGWEFLTINDVNIEIRPGCLAGLFGKKVEFVPFNQIVFRRPIGSGSTPTLSTQPSPPPLTQTRVTPVSQPQQPSSAPPPKARVFTADEIADSVKSRSRKSMGLSEHQLNSSIIEELRITPIELEEFFDDLEAEFGLTISGSERKRILSVTDIIRAFQRRNQPKAEQGGDGDAEEAV